MTAHARLSPSSADRWSTCTASVALIDQLRTEGAIPPDSSSIYAAEGTVAHAVREMCLTFGLDPHHFVGTVMSADGFTFTVDDEMARHLQPGIDWVREHTGNPDVEIRVSLDAWLPGQFGTCDTGWLGAVPMFHYDQPRQLVISDLKYGAGEPVDAVGNKQMRLYALGYWQYRGQPNVDSVLMNIDQPRAGGMKFWEISFSDLIAFGDEMREVFARIVSGKTEFAPSKKACRWCRADETPNGCDARNRWLNDMASGFKSGDLITPERRWEIVHHAPEIRAWLAKLHEESLKAALEGRPDPGSKAIEGDRGNRYFTDEAAAEALLAAALGEQAYKPRQIIGITEIEKLVKPGRKKQGHPETWDALLKLVDQPRGKPKLVPVDHASPALTSWEDDFDDLD